MFTPFSPAQKLDRERFAKDMTLPEAQTRYVMHFTPRSGSSWLTDIAVQVKQLGRPDECYNPSFMPDISRAINASDMSEYKAILLRRRNMRGVFGFQITDHQLRKVFGSRDRFAAEFPVDQWHQIWLIREDIAAQAVSLYKMVETSIAHTPNTTQDAIAKGDRDLAYDGDEIKRWLKHIHIAEQGSEAFFQETGAKPLRMSYERNQSVPPRRVLNVICAYLGIGWVPQEDTLNTQHRKIGTGLNAEFTRRFRADFPDYLKEVAKERSERIAKLSDYNAVIDAAKAHRRQGV